MRNLKFLVLALLLLTAACGPHKTPGGGNNQTAAPEKPKPPVLSPEELDRLKKIEMCRRDSNVDVSPYKCACLLNGDDSDECKCAINPNTTLKSNSQKKTEVDCECLDENSKNLEKCACYHSPNGKSCQCKENPALEICKGEAYAFQDLCDGLRSSKYTKEQLASIGEAYAEPNPSTRIDKINNLSGELQRLSNVDCDFDDLSNGVELALRPGSNTDTYSDPLKEDSDGDGLRDGDEKRLKTDPRNKDSDGDGLDDGEELNFGFSPTDPYSNNSWTDPSNNENKSKVMDGAAWQIKICETLKRKNSSLNAGKIIANDGDNWKIVLPAAAEVDSQDISAEVSTGTTKYSPSIGALGTAGSYVRFADSVGIVGAVLSVPKDMLSSGAGTKDLNALITAATSRLSSLTDIGGANLGVTDYYTFSGNIFNTHDGFKAATIEKSLNIHTSKKASELLDVIIKNLTGQSPAKTTLLSSSTNESSYFVRITIIDRSSRLGSNNHLNLKPLILISIASKTDYENPGNQQARMRMEDFTNTTNAARFNDVVSYKCDVFKTTEELPLVYFYFILDESGSMNDKNEVMKKGVEAFLKQTENTDIDYKIGISNIIPRKGSWPYGKTEPPASFTSSKYGDGVVIGDWTQDQKQIKSDVQRIIAANGGSEQGLAMAYNGIKEMRSPALINTPRGIPSRANIITTIITDEPDESAVAKSNPSDQVRFGRFTGPYDRTVIMALKPLTTIFTVCLLDSCYPYKDAALQTGGAYGALTNESITPLLTKVIEKGSSLTSTNKLIHPPISTSISLYKSTVWENQAGQQSNTAQPRLKNDKEIIYRSRNDGFDYDPGTQTVTFFGNARPYRYREDGVLKATPEYVAIGYRYFLIRSKD